MKTLGIQIGILVGTAAYLAVMAVGVIIRWVIFGVNE